MARTAQRDERPNLAPLDPALVRIIEALARAAARKDHAAERTVSPSQPQPEDRSDARSDLRQIQL